MLVFCMITPIQSLVQDQSCSVDDHADIHSDLELRLTLNAPSVYKSYTFIIQ